MANKRVLIYSTAYFPMVGGAEVSTKHANFIIARKGAKAADVLALIAQIKERVGEKFDVKLETEVVIW